MKLNFASLLVWLISSLYIPLAAAPMADGKPQVPTPESTGSSARD